MAEGEVGRHDLARFLFSEAEEPLAALRWHLAFLRAATPPGDCKQPDSCRQQERRGGFRH